MRKRVLVSIAAVLFLITCRAVLLDGSFNSSTGDGSSFGHSGVDSTNMISPRDQSRNLMIYATPPSDSPVNLSPEALGLSTEEDWTVSLEVHGGRMAAPSEAVLLNAYPMTAGYDEEAGLPLPGSSGTKPDGKTSVMRSGQAEGISIPELLLSNGTVRVSYTATNQILEITYANDSTNRYRPLLTRDVKDWPEMQTKGFIVLLDAGPDDLHASDDNVFFDNLTISLGTSPAWDSKRLPDGSIDLSTTGGVYQAMDSSNVWGTVNTAP